MIKIARMAAAFGSRVTGSFAPTAGATGVYTHVARTLAGSSLQHLHR